MTAAELQWIPVVDLTLAPDPEATPLQQTHRMALEVARTEMDLELPPGQARDALARAVRMYNKAASRPRTATCWAFVQCEPWNARAAAVRAGCLDRDSPEYRFVSDRYTDASLRIESILAQEAAGRADVRL